jgi:predicted nucleic acid-binding protein
MIVIADTSPICYLILIQAIDLLPKLYGRILIPDAVYQELKSPKSPVEVQQWMDSIPNWLEIRENSNINDEQTQILDTGEREAIALAEKVKADLIIMDEKLGRSIAKAKGFNPIGILGILYNAAQRDWIDLSKVFNDLQETTFFVSPKLLQILLEKDSQNR